MAEKQPKTMRRVKLSEIAEKPPAPEEIEDDAFFTGEEQEKAEDPEKKGKIPPIWEAVEAAAKGDFAGEFLPQGNHRDGRPADNRLSARSGRDSGYEIR